MKRMGPRTDPWGTRQVTVCGFDLEWPREMNSFQFVRYDLNQLSVIESSGEVEPV